jgi:hypothetical protein
MSTTTTPQLPNGEQLVYDGDPEMAALRKIVRTLAGDDVAPDAHILEAATAAVERVERLEAKVEAIDQRAPSPDKKTYDEMDRHDKATVIRSKLRAEAESTGGKARAKYKDIVRMFDGRPSAGHAYDLMETAAEGDGFALGTDPEGHKRLTFDARRVND